MACELAEVSAWLARHGDGPLDEILEYLQRHQVESWRAGWQVPAEVYLQLCPRLAEHVEPAVDLIYAEFLLRAELHQTPQYSEFLFRFPAYHEPLNKQFLLSTILEAEATTVAELPAHPTASTNGHLGTPGKPFGEFELHEELGHGGMGVVYRARQPGLQRYVALKMIRAGAFSTNSEIARFQKEAQNAATLEHPHIVPIYDVGVHDDHHFFTMRLMEGGTLEQHLARYTQASEAARLIISLADAVQHAHIRGILHRDLKPANVLFDDQQRPHIADFGLARRFDQASGQTLSQQVAGTLGFMAPEQLRGDTKLITIAVDVHSLGAILYVLLTGQPPYAAPSLIESMTFTYLKDPSRPRQLRSSVPQDLETICLKCLEKNPAQRYGSALELKDDVERFLAGKAIKARPVSILERAVKWTWRNPALAAIYGICGVALLAFLLAIAYSYRTTVISRQAVEESDYFNRISLAEREWAANRVDRVGTVLEACPVNLRQWEWHHLQGRLKGESRLLEGSSAVTSAIYTHDGVEVLGMLSGTPPTLARWDLASGRVTQRYPDTGIGVQHAGLNLSPDGKWIAICDTHAGAIYRLHADRLEMHLMLSHGNTRMAAFSPDSQRVATVTNSNDVYCWDLLTGVPLGPVLHLDGTPLSLAWSPDGTQLFTSNQQKQGSPTQQKERSLKQFIRIWNPVSGKVIGHIKGLRNAAQTLVFSPCGQFLAIGAWPGDPRLNRLGDVCVYDLLQQKMEHVLPAGRGTVIALGFNASSSLLTAVSSDKSVRSWLLAEGYLLIEQQGLLADHDIRIHPDGNHLLSVNVKEGIRLWDSNQVGNSRAYRMQDSYRALFALAASPDGKFLALADGEYRLHLWDTQTQSVRWTQQAHADVIHAVCFSPDGKLLATGGRDYRLKFWNVEDGQPSGVPIVFWSHIYSLAFLPGGDRLALGSRAGMVQEWDVTRRCMLRSLPVHTKQMQLALSPDGTTMISGDQVGKVLQWDLSTWTYRPLVSFKEAIDAIAWHPRGEQIALACRDAEGPIVVNYSLRDRKELHRLRSHSQQVICLSFSPDGTRLVSGGNDQFLVVSDPTTGREVVNLHGHTKCVRGVVYSNDGQSIYSASWDSFLRKWMGGGQ